MSGVGLLLRDAARRSVQLPHVNAHNTAYFLGVLALAAAIVQVALGANLAVLALALACVAIGLFCFAWLSSGNLGGWVALFYIFGNVLAALYAKTLLGQSLDSYLYAPDLSFFVLFVSVASLFGSLALARIVPVGRPILRPTEDGGLLRFLSWACFGFGCLFWYINRVNWDPTGRGFGGVNVFRDLFLMAIIARTAYRVTSSRGVRKLDAPLTLFIIASVVMGLVDNSKTHTALPVLSYFASLLFFDCRLRARHFIGLLLGGVFFVTFASPMINSYRKLGVSGMTIAQRVSLIGDTLPIVFEQGGFDRFNKLAGDQIEGFYYHYFGGGRGQLILGRYASIQQIDPVVALISLREPLGGQMIWPAFSYLVPSFLYPDKPQGTQAYEIVTALGLYDPVGGRYPTVPLAGQAYAAYGVIGILTIPFLTFLVFLLALKKFGWNPHRNVYAIFLLCQFIVVFCNQGDFSQYAGEVLRAIPVFSVVFILLEWTYRISYTSRRAKVQLGSQRMASMQPTRMKNRKL